MAIRSPKNLYPGVNAHLNSLIQNEFGEWESFHSALIVDLTRALNRVLPSGYEARNERSLQIREIALDENEYPLWVKNRRPQPDITIFEQVSGGYQVARNAIGHLTSGVITSVAETMDFDDEQLLQAIIILKITDNELFGRPITRIELLSPTNKPPSGGYDPYRQKRNASLGCGVPLVEIDLLHQLPSVVRNLPSYPDQEHGAQPYVIIVSDPRPSIHEGQAHLNPFGVDDDFPKVDIPLAEGEYLTQFDFGEVYNFTFENTPTYQRIVDYSELPMKFEAYTPDDQQRIRQRMQVIAETHPVTT